MGVDIHGEGTSGIRGIDMTFNADGTAASPLPNAIITVQPYGPASRDVAPPLPIVAQTQADAQGNFSIALVPGV